MSICKKIPQNYDENVNLTNLRRGYGLENINNVNSEFTICLESFNEPKYNTNLTKIISGLDETSPGTFIIGDSNISLNWNFTANTNTFSAYTAASFYYEIYERVFDNVLTGNPNISGPIELETFSKTPLYVGSKNFNDLIGVNLFSRTINFNNRDMEYLVKGYYEFTGEKCLFPVEVTTKLSNFNQYNPETDFYLVTLTEPEVPTLGLPNLEVKLTPGILTTNRITRNDIVSNQFGLPTEEWVFAVPQSIELNTKCKLITEVLEVGVNPRIFSLSYAPINSTILFVVNGVTLSPSDYTINNSIITTNIDMEERDVITVTYLDCDGELDSLKSENYQIIDSIVSGTTSATTLNDKVYFNTDQLKYEYYLNQIPEDPENIIFYLNGIQLTYGLDFYISTSVPNRLILDSTLLNPTDLIFIVYLSSDSTIEGDLGVVNTSEVIISWQVSPTVINDIRDGYFLVEVTNSSDINFTNPIFTTNVNWINGDSIYSTAINGLIPDSLYIYRVINYKIYYGLLNNIFTTNSISINGRIETKKLSY